MTTKDFTISPIDVAARAKLDVRAGDTVRVWQKITERFMEKDKVKEKTRSQAFEGLVLARKHGSEPGATFTVRKVIDGIGVEKIFPLYAPSLEKVEILRRSKVRRAKLYHIREKAAKEIRREMRNSRAVRADDTVAEIVVKTVVDKKAE
ncbi:MAG: 50S ribosomal protein L19 [Candidatus Taylorbacteria bacterium]|nr:50S ribosomal protein L19 [Candidatus Taylorbacteria bacterium]